MSLEEEFNKAKKIKSYRQSFINQIDLEFEARFVHDVIYDPKQRYSTLNTNVPLCMGCKLRPIKVFNRLVLFPFRKVDIYIYPIAFSEQIPNLTHFLNILIDHEGFHARKLYYNPWLAKDYPKNEFDAYWNQIMKSERRGLDDAWRENLAFASCIRTDLPF